MRRIVVAAVAAFVIGGAAWALWPATKWPQVFCAPVVRVVGADAVPIAKSFSHPEPTLTATQEDEVATLAHDVQLAEAAAPTAQLRAELNRYLAELGVKLSTLTVTDAMGQFDQHARTQLRACGVRPIGS
ncbi:MAG TPA: hypothetical protein VMU68_00955 [Acidimicrobiales bacterium]|nr:hypothetical protein [Acidimicrobiales bacterium]